MSIGFQQRRLARILILIRRASPSSLRANRADSLHTQLVIAVTDAPVTFCILSNFVAAAVATAGLAGLLSLAIIGAIVAVFTGLADIIVVTDGLTRKNHCHSRLSGHRSQHHRRSPHQCRRCS